jgi:integrase
MRDLTVKEVTALRKPGKHRVSRNLYLQLTETGARSWLFRYERHGAAHWHGLGSYDLVPLAEAREKALACRKLVLAGIDPIAHERAQRQQALLAAVSTMTFRECAAAYLASHEASWRSDIHRQQWIRSLEKYVYPLIGDLPVQAVDVGLVLKVLEPIWHRKTETGSRVRGRIEAVLDWAKARGYRQGDNPARWRGHLDQLLPKPTKLRKVQHMAAMPYAEMPSFMPRLRAQSGIPARALEFTIYTVARPAEALEARWHEVDLDAQVWVVPGKRMKGGADHRVPLSDRAVEILRALPREDGNPRVFISARRGKALSPAAMLRVLRDLGVDCTVHGFRSSSRDWAGETTAHAREVIEAALAHRIKDKAEAAYARGDLFQKRRRLMEAWARYCSTPRAAGDVVAFARKG